MNCVKALWNLRSTIRSLPPINWATVSKASPGLPGWWLECPGHFPHSRLRHFCVQSLREMFHLVKQMLGFIKVSWTWVTSGDSWGGAWPSCSKSSPGVCHVPGPLPPLCDIPGYSLVTLPIPMGGGLWEGWGNRAKQELGFSERGRARSKLMGSSCSPTTRANCHRADLSVGWKRSPWNFPAWQASFK